MLNFFFYENAAYDLRESLLEHASISDPPGGGATTTLMYRYQTLALKYLHHVVYSQVYREIENVMSFETAGNGMSHVAKYVTS